MNLVDVVEVKTKADGIYSGCNKHQRPCDSTEVSLLSF